MAGSLNKVCLIGNLGKDPEIRTLNSGDKVATFSMAMTESWRDKNSGEKKERTEWATVVCFNDGLVKVIEQYLEKGAKVYIEGALQTRKYEKNGENRYVTEVVLQKYNGTLVMLGARGEGGGGGDRYESQRNDYGSSGDNARQDARGNPRESFPADLDDEIPF